MRKNYYTPKPKTTAICITCGITFPTRRSNKHGECLKCHGKIYQQKYFAKKKAVNPFWNHERYLKFKGKKNTKVQKLYEAKITLEKYLDKVQLQREKIKMLEGEIKNGK